MDVRNLVFNTDNPPPLLKKVLVLIFAFFFCMNTNAEVCKPFDGHLCDIDALLKPNSSTNAEEKKARQERYVELLGILAELRDARANFLAGNLIDIFPTAYYNTTRLEMQRIAAGQFKYPVEKMDQMIAFYDAYKWNRNHIDAGNYQVVESHWREYAEKANIKAGSGWNDAWVWHYRDALQAGINAHVYNDLERAIRETYRNIALRDIPYKPTDLAREFMATNDIFAASQAMTLEDIKSAMEWWVSEIPLKYGPIILGWFGNDETSKIIKRREQAWWDGTDEKSITGATRGSDGQILAAQPKLDNEHAERLRRGQEFCTLPNIPLTYKFNYQDNRLNIRTSAEVGIWMFQNPSLECSAIADWRGQGCGGNVPCPDNLRLLEPINVLWIDFEARSLEQRNKNIETFLYESGFTVGVFGSGVGSAHSYGYSTIMDGKWLHQYPTGGAFTDGTSAAFENNHGRIFLGVMALDDPNKAFYTSGAFSRETGISVKGPGWGHYFVSFNQARDALKVANGWKELKLHHFGNEFGRHANEPYYTGDHDSVRVFVRYLSRPVLFLFDTSGSMKGSKIEQAKQAALQNLEELKKSQASDDNNRPIVAAVAHFGGSCGFGSLRTIQDFSDNVDAVELALNFRFSPRGLTPLVTASSEAKGMVLNYLKGAGQGEIILLSDGEDTCESPRPAGVYSRASSAPFRTTRIKVTAQDHSASVRYLTIGFDIKPGSAAERDLQYLASSSNGRYYSAQNQRQLTRAFAKHLKSYVPKPISHLVSLGEESLSYLQEGNRSIYRRDYAAAITAFQSFTKTVPQDPIGRYNLALALEATDHYKAAAEQYKQYLILAPNAPDRADVEVLIPELEQDYIDYFHYQVEIIKSDLAYLQNYYQRLFNQRNESLAMEFSGFVREKKDFYRTLPDVLEVDAQWLKDGSFSVSSSIDRIARQIDSPSFDRDAVSLLSLPIKRLKTLAEKLEIEKEKL